MKKFYSKGNKYPPIGTKAKKKYQGRRMLPINKIAKIKTADLPIEHHKNEPLEHYVYIREYDREKGVYKVNVCTHLDSYDKRQGKFVENEKHIKQVKMGNTYPIPVTAATFPRWTGIKKDVYEVSKGKMYKFGCVKFNKTHKKEDHDKYFL